MKQRGGLWMASTAFVRFAILLNGAFLLAVLAGQIASWIVPGFFETLLRQANAGRPCPHGLALLRSFLLVGIAMSIAIHRFLSPLLAIIGTARAGDPFVAANIGRLRAAGWALLALQLLDIPCRILVRLWPGSDGGGSGLDMSLGGWLATLSVFLLARVFASGTSLRDETQGLV